MREDSLDAELRRRGASDAPTRRPPHPPREERRSDPDRIARAPMKEQISGGASRGAYHEAGSGSQNVGNHIGSHSSVRQSKLFRMYESGNATKAILGQQNLQWNVDSKEGAYQGKVFDAFNNQSAYGTGQGHDVGRVPAGGRPAAVAMVRIRVDPPPRKFHGFPWISIVE